MSVLKAIRHALVVTIGVTTLWASSASAQPSMTPHLFYGWTDTFAPGTTVYEATLTVPNTMSHQTFDASAWVMATPGPRGSAYTQVGWEWAGGMAPMVFAESDPSGDTYYRHYVDTDGPSLAPNSPLTVRIVREGSRGAAWYIDQYLWDGHWATLTSFLIAGPVVGETYVETYGPVVPTCFAKRAMLDVNTWIPLSDGCQP